MSATKSIAVKRDGSSGSRVCTMMATVAASGGNKCVLKLDSTAQAISAQILDTAGDPVAGAASISLDLGDLTGTNKAVQFREFKFKDYENDCAEMSTWILCTEPEAVA